MKKGTTVPQPSLTALANQTAGREPANKFNLGPCVSLAQGLYLYFIKCAVKPRPSGLGI